MALTRNRPLTQSELRPQVARMNPRVLVAADPWVPALRAGRGSADDSPSNGDPAGPLSAIALQLDRLEAPELRFLESAVRAPVEFHSTPAGAGRLTGGADEIGRLLTGWSRGPEPGRSLARILGDTLETARLRRFDVPLAHGRTLELDGDPVLMGILNVTPDSFSDGGRYSDPERAVNHALEMAEAGAAIIDVGGESTRPGSEGVTARVERERVLPVVERIRERTDALISIDTSKAEVARAGIEAGAHLINDVTALRGDPGLAGVAAASDAGLVLMHMRGTPRDMQQDPTYEDVSAEVLSSLREALWLAHDRGVSPERTLVDPGIGFGKTLAHNLALLHRLSSLRSLGRPVVLGASRKSFLGQLTGVTEPDRRMPASLGIAALAATHGVSVLRVHDVAETRQAVRSARAMFTGRPPLDAGGSRGEV